jgi:hypothetical protein
MKNRSTILEATSPLLVKAMDARRLMGNISTNKFNQLVKPLLNPIAVSPILIFYKYTDLKNACDILEERYGRSPLVKGVGLWEGEHMKDLGSPSEKVRSIFRSPEPSSAIRLEEALEPHLGKRRK